MKIKEGDQLPDAKVFILDTSPKEVSIREVIKEEKCILFGLPGAFTSTCSTKHLPGFINAVSGIKAKNIKKVICISVNDPFVMNAWGKENNVDNKIIMLGDPFLNFTKDIGADVDKSGRGLGIRSNRYTMFVENMKVIKLQEEKDTGTCEISAAENFIKLI